MVKLTHKQKQKIISMYKNGIPSTDITITMGVSVYIILKLLRKNGIQIKKSYREINAILGKKIIRDYNNGKSLMQLAAQFKYDKRTIRKYLKANGIRTRTHIEVCRKLRYDENFFSKIQTEAQAYFYGLLLSDGYNRNNGFALSLQAQDREILDAFTKHLGYDGKLRFIKRRKENHKDNFQLQINSTKISSDLSAFGCIRAKSHKTYFPKIPSSLYNHFIRGVFDGDGCIFTNGNAHIFNIVGNRSLIKTIQIVLMDKCILNKTKLQTTKKRAKNIVTVQYGGAKQVCRIRDYLYKDATIFLMRKKLYFERIVTQSRIGLNNPSCKLSEKQVLSIFNSTINYNNLAAKYNVSRSTIERIKYKKGWRHLL